MASLNLFQILFSGSKTGRQQGQINLLPGPSCTLLFLLCSVHYVYVVIVLIMDLFPYPRQGMHLNGTCAKSNFC